MKIIGRETRNKEAKCPTYRHFGVELKKPTPGNAERTQITGKAVTEVKFGRMTLAELPTFITESMKEIEVGNDLTR